MSDALPSATVCLELYRRMWRIRLFEQAAADRQTKGEIPGVLHSSIGQEATVVGACGPLTDSDYMTGTHRSHGHPIAKGSGVDRLMAELMGKSTGVCHGKGGSMHLADFAVGSLGESGIVGGAMPIAAGAGLSIQMRGSDAVCLCFFGDGGANTGAFHEALNLAGVWKLPVVFLCENNGYAVTTPFATTTAVLQIADRAVAYSMPGVVVDGQDVFAVFDVVGEAVARARRGEGPSLIEAMTFHYREHAEMGGFDLGPYRSDEEVDAWKQRDPIEIARNTLVGAGVLDADAAADIERSVEAEIAAAVKFARRSPLPEAAEAFEDLYATPIDKRPAPTW
jgi:pyruvate dehydrogenase E1 component alpha subunit